TLYRSRALLQKVLHADPDEIDRDLLEFLARERDERQMRRDAPQRDCRVAAVGVGQREIDQGDFEPLLLNDVLGFPELSYAANLVIAVEKRQCFGERSCRVDVVLA